MGKTETIIDVRDLSFAYGKKDILKNISASIPKASIVSLIGPNGCGKSTFLRCLAGILKAADNTIMIKDKAIESFEKKILAQNIAFLPQFQEKLMAVSVYDLIAMGRTAYHGFGWVMSPQDKEKIKWAIGYMNLSKYQNHYINTLSGGQRQRVWIAMILAQDTPIVLLDEPVTYMDLKHQQELLSLILDLKYSYGKTIIGVFHDINHAMEISDLVYMMKDGQIYAQGPAEQVLTEKSIAKVYDVYAHVHNFKKCCRKVVVPESCRYRNKQILKEVR